MERKNKKKTIELTCSFCGNRFVTDLKYYTRRQKLNEDKWYCNRTCKNNVIKTDEFSPFRTFLILCKKNVKNKNLEFDLDLEYLKHLWENQKGICPFSKIKMVLFPTCNKTEFKPDAASLDRIDSSKGYVKGNVQFVCLSINYAKNRFDTNEFVDFLSRIRPDVSMVSATL